jgi:hypothetical protein
MAVDAINDYTTNYVPPQPVETPPPEAEQAPEAPPEVSDISAEMGLGNNLDIRA